MPPEWPSRSMLPGMACGDHEITYPSTTEVVHIVVHCTTATDLGCRLEEDRRLPRMRLSSMASPLNLSGVSSIGRPELSAACVTWCE